jgi:hypothetical protein
MVIWREQFEAVNVQTGAVLPLAEKPTELMNYGLVTGELEVTKTQLFY